MKPRSVISLDDAFWARVNKDGPVVRPELGPCWQWIGSVHRVTGYGQLQHGRRGAKVSWRAHRLSYFLNVGELVDGLVILHACDNPACVNPRHLSQGTHQDNNDDMRHKGRDRTKYPVWRGEAHFSAKLTNEQVLEIRSLKGRETQPALARRYGVCRATIDNIQRRVNWKHI